jgi:hypothetical protein
MGPLSGGSITDRQAKTVAAYEAKDKLTERQSEELARLVAKRDAPPELPTGAKGYAENWLHDRIYRRRREFSAEQTEKGNRTEQAGFEMIKEYLQDPFMREHPERVRGEYIEGECDILSPSVLYDCKAAFTHESMPLLNEKVSKAHWCQLQGYGHLYGYKRLARAYVLTDMPEDMIEKKAYYATKAKYGPDFLENEYQEQLEKMTRKYTYHDVPLSLRVMISEFDYDPDFIEQVTERVKMIREYLTELENGLPDSVKEAVREMNNQSETAQKEAVK